jgi:hypothetical protein
MTTERDSRTRIVLSWLREDAHENAERMLLRALDEVDATPQRPSWWLARRSSDMNNFAKALVAAAAVVVVAIVGINLLSGNPSGVGGLQPSPSTSIRPTQEPTALSPTTKPTASLVAYSLTPFKPVGVEGEEDPRAASVTFDFTAPSSWEPFGDGGVSIDGNGPPDGGEATVIFYRGFNLFSDPCRTVDEEASPVADIPVGPTVDDLVTALVDHPLLDVTDPVDVTLAGYSGKYLDLTIPDDKTDCANYRPMDVQHLYAQGPGQRWHMWILDVDGVRVLVETNDYPGTPPNVLAEEQAIIESLEITP